MRLSERRELKAVLDKLERAQLPGDVGRMIFLAWENATDERDQDAAIQARTARRRRTLGSRLRRMIEALAPTRLRG